MPRTTRRKPAPRFESEAELAAHIVEFLNSQGFEVYQEVICNDGCADIVARVGPLLWVIECKLTLGFEVAAQARAWRPYANFVSVAVPESKSRDDLFASEVLEKFEIGLLTVRPGDGQIRNKMRKRWEKTFGPKKSKVVTPQDACLARAFSSGQMDDRFLGAPYRRRILPNVRNALHENHKTYTPAGSGAAKRWTPFKDTCEQLRKHVHSSPGIALKTALLQITHHYASHASARACMARLIEEGVVEGVSLRKEGKSVTLWPT